MIRNDRQFSIAQARADRLASTERDVLRRAAAGEIDERRSSLELRTVRGELGALKSDLAEYSDLREGRVTPGPLRELSDLPVLLIRARIASGLTQAGLAARLGMKEQQIQRYEASDYQSVALARLLDIAAALDLSLTPAPAPTDTDSATIWRLIEQAGLPRDLAARRFADPGTSDELQALGALTRVAHAFDTSAEVILSGSADLIGARSSPVAYKRPDHLRKDTSSVLAAYAKTLGSIVERCVDVDPRDLPREPLAFRRLVLDRYNELSLASVIQTLWDHGIPTLPLAEVGGFHAGLWQGRERPAVVLNSAVAVSARWLFDLLHEVGHLVEPSTNGLPDRFEEAVDGASTAEDPSEARANEFANDVLFEGRVHELVAEVFERSEGRPELRQRAVRWVARNREVDQGHLAYAVAFELRSGGENWWGAAQNMQLGDLNPWLVVRDLLLENTDFAAVGQIDRELLTLAFADPILTQSSDQEDPR